MLEEVFVLDSKSRVRARDRARVDIRQTFRVVATELAVHTFESDG